MCPLVAGEQVRKLVAECCDAARLEADNRDPASNRFRQNIERSLPRLFARSSMPKS